MRWSEEQIAALRTDWANGLSATETAQKLGSVTRDAVVGKRRRLGLRDQMRYLHPAKSREGMKVRRLTKCRTDRVRPELRSISVPTRKRVIGRRLPEMSKAALREMLQCAVANTI